MVQIYDDADMIGEWMVQIYDDIDLINRHTDGTKM